MPHSEPTAEATPAPIAEASSRPEDEHENDAQWLEDSEELPRRPRRRLLTPVSILLVAALLVAVGFIAGTRIEKQEASGGSSSAAVGGLSSTAVAGGASSGSGGTAAGPTGAPSAGATGAGGSSAGAVSRTSAPGVSASQPTSGTVAYLSGSTLYVTDSEGNTVKVNTTNGTSVTRTVKQSVARIRPGESVTVLGTKQSGGGVAARTITVGGTTGLAGGFGGVKPGAAGALPAGGPPSGGPPSGAPPFG
jgi:hypothetical protein